MSPHAAAHRAEVQREANATSAGRAMSPTSRMEPGDRVTVEYEVAGGNPTHLTPSSERGYLRVVTRSGKVIGVDPAAIVGHTSVPLAVGDRVDMRSCATNCVNQGEIIGIDRGVAWVRWSGGNRQERSISELVRVPTLDASPPTTAVLGMDKAYMADARHQAEFQRYTARPLVRAIFE